MSEHEPRTGPARDVPPPRPVAAPPPPPVEETGVGRAARAVADAVAGLVSSARGADPAGGSARSAAGGLKDVVGAVGTALGAAFGRDETRTAAAEGTSGDRTPAALLGDLLAAAAPRLPIRDAARLRQAYPGLTDDEIADALVARAAKATSSIGAATGGLSAAHWFAPASLLALPIELGAETVLIAGIEVVLIGELHELHGRPAPGDARARAAAYLASWSTQRPVAGAGTSALGSLLGSAGMRAVRKRVARKLAGSVPTAAPFMIGAAIAGRGNRRATEELAERVRAELRDSPAAEPGS
ncbi:hypothetical protein [Blastococcus sp. PRF04-17]|uniref:hypothetical protein n=1 Tax=Blastococcus sp. PRF04-17 TaxID=2933797 RepID=UPI001FF0FA92|nr:hypothetical protein [Blastococcus sp. PRF04-17]UOY02038.1 hypothetical protein MVA48_01235 [Blastococcus sp. PRF04-17]